MVSDTDHSDDRRSDLAVLDANEYKQMRRLERILDAHDNPEDVYDEAWSGYIHGRIDRDAVNAVLLASVQRYIREIYQLLLDYEERLGEDETSYLYDVPLGTLELEREDDIFFRGLQSILDASAMYIETWSETVASRHSTPETVERERAHSVPERVSWEAYLRINEFLYKRHDLEIQFEEMEDTRGKWSHFTFETEGEQVPDEMAGRPVSIDEREVVS